MLCPDIKWDAAGIRHFSCLPVFMYLFPSSCSGRSTAHILLWCHLYGAVHVLALLALQLWLHIWLSDVWRMSVEYLSDACGMTWFVVA